MVNTQINKECLNWDGEVLITDFQEKNLESRIKLIVSETPNEVLHIHYGCDYVGVMIIGTSTKQGCFSCFERQYDINNGLFVEKNLDKYVSSECFDNELMQEVNTILVSLVDQMQETSCKEYVYIIRYKSLEIEKINVRKMEDCVCCGSIVDDYAWKPNLKEEFFSSENSFRVKEKVDVKQIKEKIYNYNSGLFQYVYKYFKSQYIPIICSEFNDVATSSKVRSFGRSFRMSGVESSALLEGLERYSGMLPRKRKCVVRECYEDIKDVCVKPEKFILHTGHNIENYGMTYYKSNQPYNWIWGYSWKNKGPVLIPEQIAYYDVNKDTKEKRFIYETSNGVALGGSWQEAALYGLYELIERDAFLLAWFNRYKPVKIDINSIQDEKIMETIRLVQFNGYRVHIFDITTENKVPAVWVLLENPKKDAKVRSYSAAGAHTNPYKAIEGGLVEAITSMPIYESILPAEKERAILLNKDYSQVTMMEDHVLMYSVPESFEKLQYLFEDEKYSTIDELYPNWKKYCYGNSLTQTLSNILDRIASYHDDIYIVDQTNDLTESFDLYCAKIIIPTMQNMYFGEQFKRLNVNRIRWGAVYAGWREDPIDEADINIVPHPFP